MKKIILITVIVNLCGSLYSKDFSKTEDIINSILKDSPVIENKVENEKIKKNIPSAEKKEQTQEAGDNRNKPIIMSSNDQVLLKTGIQLYHSGFYTEAAKQFNNLKSKYSESRFIDSSNIWLGKISLKQYKYDNAISQFSQIKEDSGEYPTAQYYIGECYIYKGSAIKSIEYFQNVSSRFPQHELSDNALLKISKIYYNRKKGNQALGSTVRLIKYYKERETIDDAYYLLGKIFEKDPVLKDPERVRGIYKAFLKKAKSGNIQFKNSPLKARVIRDLKYIENNYFMLEN